jgi:hypothetical protein
VYLKTIYYTNRHNAGKQDQAFALPTQDMPSVTARPAMRLGFHIRLLDVFFGANEPEWPAAVFDIHQSDIFPSALCSVQ